MKITKNQALLNDMNGRIKREVSAGLLQWGEAVVSHAADHAPIKSGALRRSITRSPVIELGHIATGNVILQVRVGPDASVKDYAPRQELDESLGFGSTSSAAGATRPWLRPAFDISVVLGKALVRAGFARAMRK